MKMHKHVDADRHAFPIGVLKSFIAKSYPPWRLESERERISSFISNHKAFPLMIIASMTHSKATIP